MSPREILDDAVIADRLEGLAGDARRAVAVDMVGAMGTDEMKRLTDRTRMQLLRGITLSDEGAVAPDMPGKGPERARIANALGRLYLAMPLKPEFLAFEAAANENLTRDLRWDKDIRAAAANWRGMDDAARLAVLEKIITAQCRAHGVAPPDRVILFDQPADAQGLIRGGCFDTTRRELLLNRNPGALFQNFAGIVEAVMHENTHNIQLRLFDKLEAGELAADDPRRAQIEIMRENQSRGAVGATEDLYLYQNQPVEAHAHAAGKQLSQAILPRKGFAAVADAARRLTTRRAPAAPATTGGA